MPKAFLVLNPVTGLIPPVIRRRWFENHFKRHKWEYEVYETTGAENLPEIVRQQINNGVDLIAASGGDGTVSSVASGMLNTNVPLGILPTGTGNLFARDIGIPIDPDRAIKLLTAEHHYLDLDMMVVEDRAFVMNISLGLSANTIKQTERIQKIHFGLFAYVWNAAVNLFGIRLEKYNLEVDGVSYNIRASEIMVVNSSLIGLRTLQQKTSVIPDDGKVEVCVFRARTVGDWLSVLGNVIIGHYERRTFFRVFHAYNHISIKTKHPKIIQGDGEMLGSTPVEITVVPRALRIIVPPPAETPVSHPNPFNLVQAQPTSKKITRRSISPPAS